MKKILILLGVLMLTGTTFAATDEEFLHFVEGVLENSTFSNDAIVTINNSTVLIINRVLEVPPNYSPYAQELESITQRLAYECPCRIALIQGELQDPLGRAAVFTRGFPVCGQT